MLDEFASKPQALHVREASSPGVSQDMRPIALGLLLIALPACAPSAGTEGPSGDQLPIGRWGAVDQGVIVSADLVHIHVGCTKGDFPAPIQLDAQGRFQVDGTYMLRAFPVARETLPAQVSGVVSGRRLTLSIAVNDTVLKKPTSVGPITVTLGVEPRMANCPICVDPAARAR